MKNFKHSLYFENSIKRRNQYILAYIYPKININAMYFKLVKQSVIIIWERNNFIALIDSISLETFGILIA